MELEATIHRGSKKQCTAKKQANETETETDKCRPYDKQCTAKK